MRKLTAKEKFKIAYRDDFTCQYCGSRTGNSDIEIDHMIPVTMGGSDHKNNLIAACKKCNRNKSDLVVFPMSKCEGVDTLDSEWLVHKSFGAWQVKFHYDCGVVLEYTPYGYFIESGRVYEMDWTDHVTSKGWPLPHTDDDFINGINYIRSLVDNEYYSCSVSSFTD
jgi:hypothetical protein